MIKTAILGGTGYGGMELLRLLLSHPGAEVTVVTSRTEEGAVGDRHPHLRGFTDLRFTRETPEVLDRLAASNDLLFQAKPHGVSARETPALLAANPALKVIDLSGDFRLKDASLYETWYGFAHPRPDLLAEAVYGLPECGGRAEVADARLVANPGCHAAATLLALWPLVRGGALGGRAAVTSVTGSSGSGAVAKPGTHHPERFSNFKAYRPLHHQHLPEVLQALGDGTEVDFVPCSAPLSRGIYVTAFAPVGDRRGEDVAALFAAAYRDEPFVRLREDPPELRAVAGTNMADVSVTIRAGTAVVNVAIDNLGKGMAGTAVQNLNLLFGLDETTGLAFPGAGL
ncbi:MAG: N-acetyl-gamma-glutamyl-phosphate reductase [Planctomycetota bacterium]|jgi:N-acetyl-gamma-glutamyl-phosphate reductase